MGLEPTEFNSDFPFSEWFSPFWCTYKQRYCYGGNCAYCYDFTITWKISYSCPYCGLLVEVEDIYCKYCGKKLQKSYCPTCGKELEETK